MPQAAQVYSMADYRKSAGNIGQMSRRPANTLTDARAAMAELLSKCPNFDGMGELDVPLALMHWQNDVVRGMRQVLAV